MLVYLDNSATTRAYDEVIEKMSQSMAQVYGNPSSLHGLGLEAEKAVKNARQQVAAGLGCSEKDVFFTSGGTESDNMAILEGAGAVGRKNKRIITTAVEHPAVLQPFEKLENEGYEAVRLGVNSEGRLDLDMLEAAVDENTALVSIMHVNNETGVVYPIDEIGRIIKKKNSNTLFHTDAVQSFGKIDINLTRCDCIDMLSLSGHKIHGPKGTGAIFIRKGTRIHPFVIGGGQEQNMRSGTENVPGITGLGLASEMACRNLKQRTEAMDSARKYLLEGIKSEIKDIRINSPQDRDYCPSVLNISFLGTRGEVILHMLEDEKIYVSTGSACSSNKKGRSHVLTAMGLGDKEIEGAIRFSFSEFNTAEEMEYVLDKVKTCVKRFRRLGSFR